MDFENKYGDLGWGEFEYVTITEVEIENTRLKMTL